ncbi:hypothetical protein [Novosphingobium rosa]|uniref:hypothetical protein n=1 Tax=Novosphingobium rosa TaxID=76978 RepID=UPI00083131A6|nr:hypothetical protein [Novosphingobium rosa]
MTLELLRHLGFLALLLASSAYALAKGGRPERIAATTLLCGALLSLSAARPLQLRFHHLERGILAIDLVILGIFLWLSLRTTRFWPMWIAALLSAEVLIHIALLLVPGAVPVAYRNGEAIWSWGAQTILIIATWRHRNRLDRLGSDPPWRE